MENVTAFGNFGYVYIVTNISMPGLVKIGKTIQDDVQARLAQLYASSGVPFPFQLEFAGRVENPTEVERALHVAFAPTRVNPKREFFKIGPEQAIAILKLLHVDDETSSIARRPVEGVTPAEVEAADRFQARRPPLNFHEMGLGVEAEISFIDDPLITARIVGPRTVQISGIEMSITAATRQALGVNYNVAPSRYWNYRGRSLKMIYDETYPGDVSE